MAQTPEASSTTTAGTSMSEMDDEEDPFAGLDSVDSDNDSLFCTC